MDTGDLTVKGGTITTTSKDVGAVIMGGLSVTGSGKLIGIGPGDAFYIEDGLLDGTAKGSLSTSGGALVDVEYISFQGAFYVIGGGAAKYVEISGSGSGGSAPVEDEEEAPLQRTITLRERC